MNCIDLRRMADAYVDGELKPPDHSRMEAHVLQCNGCRQWVEMVQRARDTVRGRVVKGPAPHGLEARIRESITTRVHKGDAGRS